MTPNITVNAVGKAHVVDAQWPTDPIEWAAMHGLVPVDGVLRLWKTTNIDGLAFRDQRTAYIPGQETVATDWSPNFSHECGAGLHFGHDPQAAKSFVAHNIPFRLFSVLVKLEDIRCYGPYPDYPHKCRARACVVETEWSPEYDGDGTDVKNQVMSVVDGKFVDSRNPAMVPGPARWSTAADETDKGLGRR